MYMRTKNFYKNNTTARYYNANVCDIRKLLNRRDSGAKVGATS